MLSTGLESSNYKVKVSLLTKRVDLHEKVCMLCIDVVLLSKSLYE